MGETYTAATFRRAITRAVRAANRERTEQGLQPLPNWTPYQLRHAAATRMRKDHGIEVTRCLMGHSSASMTEHYAQLDLDKARAAMEKSG